MGKAGGRTNRKVIDRLPSCILGTWAGLQLEPEGPAKRAPYPAPSPRYNPLPKGDPRVSLQPTKALSSTV